MKKLFYLLVAIMAVSILSAQEKNEMRDDLRSQMNETTDVDKKLEMMYNIFDRAPRDEAIGIAEEILHYADSTHNDTLGLEMLCQLAFLNVRNDSVLQQLSEKVVHYPESQKKNMARTYIALRRAGCLVLYSTDGERLNRMKELLQSDYFEKSANIYERIEILGTVCMLTGSNTANKNILVNYLNQLIDIANQLDDNDIYLRNLIYNYSSNLYTNIGESQKAVLAAKKRIETLKYMTDMFHAGGRTYYNFDIHFFQAYRILLSNFEELSMDEVDYYYALAEELAETNETCNEEFQKGSPQAYYLLAHKKYKEAIPYLQKILQSQITNFSRRHALRHLIDVAEKVGDTEVQLQATNDYINLLETLMANDAASSEAEMKARYDVVSLQADSIAKEKEQLETINRMLIVIGVISAIVLIIFFLLYRRSAKLSRQLHASNEELKHEGETLRHAQEELIKARDKATRAEQHKTEFINNISHEIVTPLESIVEYTQLIVDCTDAVNNKYLSKYADIVKLNTELFLTLVNDIFEINSLENHNLKVKKVPVTLSEICRLSADSVKLHLRNGVRFEFAKADAPDSIIVTDAKRVQQVIINLLNNAAKFTAEGSIVLDYNINRDDNLVTFIVTDTGCGIPDGKEEEIFNRFTKLDKQSQGVGLGLAISRMIADLLQGSITVDTSYKKGARFIFTIPMS